MTYRIIQGKLCYQRSAGENWEPVDQETTNRLLDTLPEPGDIPETPEDEEDGTAID